jgi:enamine deaminase RidA (YjgF/YER057c/UK114 family)
MSTHEPIVPPGHEAAYERFHFAPAVRAGDTILVSGVIGRGADGTVPADPLDEYRAAFVQIGVVLAAAGADHGDIVEITSFHTDLPATMREFAQAKDEAIGRPFPAWTAVGVSALMAAGARAEIRVTAHRPVV